MRFIATLLLTGLLLLAGTTAARADYVVWRDAHSGLSLSFPDTWRIVNNFAPDDVLMIMAPSGDGYAACRVRVREDRRYLIYPSHFSGAIQRVEFSSRFWDQYIQDYENTWIQNVYDGAGLGRGHAGYAIAYYRSAVPGPETDRKALMFASLYNDKLYILECSARRGKSPPDRHAGSGGDHENHGFLAHLLNLT